MAPSKARLRHDDEARDPAACTPPPRPEQLDAGLIDAGGGAAAWALSLPGSGLPPSAQAYVNVGLAVFAFAIAAAFVLRSPALAPAPRCASVPSHLAQIM